MQSESNIALKEWAVVCEALAGGRQRVLFRKGGIHEGPEGFVPEHREFWLFPTGFHQSLEGVRPEFREDAVAWLNREGVQVAKSSQSTGPPSAIPIQHFCRVRSLHWVDDEVKLAALHPYHVLSAAAISQRFHYRKPGVFVMVVETSSLPEPKIIAVEPRYDSCRSWVTLKESLPTSGCVPSERNYSAGDVDLLIRQLLAEASGSP